MILKEMPLTRRVQIIIEFIMYRFKYSIEFSEEGSLNLYGFSALKSHLPNPIGIARVRLKYLVLES